MRNSSCYGKLFKADSVFASQVQAHTVAMHVQRRRVPLAILKLGLTESHADAYLDFYFLGWFSWCIDSALISGGKRKALAKFATR